MALQNSVVDCDLAAGIGAFLLPMLVVILARREMERGYSALA